MSDTPPPHFIALWADQNTAKFFGSYGYAPIVMPTDQYLALDEQETDLMHKLLSQGHDWNTAKALLEAVQV